MMHVTFYYHDSVCGGEIKNVREVNCIPVIGDTIYFSLDNNDEKCLKGKFVVSGREFWFERGGLKTTIILTRK